MRLRLLARLRRSVRSRPVRGGARAPSADLARDVRFPSAAPGGRHRREARPELLPGTNQSGREAAPPAEQPFGSPVRPARQRPGQVPRDGTGRARRPGSAAARAAVRTALREATDVRPAGTARPAAGAARSATRDGREHPAAVAGLPWYEVAHARRAAEGWRDCGPLEAVLQREWEQGEAPPPEVVRAIDRLAELPPTVKESLAAGIDSIHVGAGGVPDLDHMGRLRNVPLPSGRATWDACAGAYGERKIVVGSRPSAAPDVMCHEVGHALDDIDGAGGWQSDSADFRALYDRCLPHLVSDFHRQEEALGRREFFADAFSAIASSQRPALVDMLGGDTRMALEVMLYFNVRYRI